METQPNTENVHYIDEYPELKKRVWLRKLAAQRVAQVVDLPRIIPFQKEPDGAAQ